MAESSAFSTGLHTVSNWHLAWRQMARDFRAGELHLLIVAVVLAVAAVSSVGFLADRIKGGLTRDARQLLGGDAVVVSDQPIAAEFANKAQALGLQVATTANFPSMGRAPNEKGGASRLVAVKSVSQAYPLRGRLRLSDVPDGAERSVAAAPSPGTVWVDASLLDALQLQVGDPLHLGDATLRIAAVIVIEPDRGAGFLNFAPRVMLHEADLEATGLIQPASRVTYRLAVAAPPKREAAVSEFVKWTEQHIKAQALRGARIESLESGRPEMSRTLERAEKFLNLVALLVALLAAVAVGITARDFANRHLDDCAMLRVLGQSQRAIAMQYLIEFGCVGLGASLAGVLVGFAVHYGFVWLLAGLVNTDLPAASLWPALFGVGIGLALLMGFGLPPVLQLSQVPALRVIRRDLGVLKPASLATLLAGTVCFVALLFAVSSDLKLGLIAVGGFAAAVVMFAGMAWGAMQVLRHTLPKSGAPRWLILATRQMVSRSGYAVLQITGLSVGLFALCVLVLLRTDLISSWHEATPADAPNRFVINVQPDQSEAFQTRLRTSGVSSFDWYPMVRGRLVSINSKAVLANDFADDRAKRLMDREFNLSYSAVMPAHNQITEGLWVPEEQGGISVEEGLAETFDLKLGDTLGFDVAGTVLSGRITSLRKVEWGSMRANFFVMFPVATLSDVPLSYIASFRAPPVPGFDNQLSRDFPNITTIDVSSTIRQVQRILDQVIRAVEFLFGFSLLVGLVVLFAALAATREVRAREFAVMRALGASNKLLVQVQRAELLGMGALAGLLASFAAAMVGWALARYVFEFSWSFSPWLLLAGSVVGSVLALVAGWWSLRGVLRRPVMETLRSASNQ